MILFSARIHKGIEKKPTVKKKYQKQPSRGVLGKGALKICSRFTGEHPCRSVIWIHCNFIEITLRHGCSPLNLLHIFRTAFTKNTSGGLLVNYILIKEIIKNINPPFALLNTLKHFLEKYRFCPKSSNDTNRRGWGRGEERGGGRRAGSHVNCVIMIWNRHVTHL